jgi:hypothetical protein
MYAVANAATVCTSTCYHLNGQVKFTYSWYLPPGYPGCPTYPPEEVMFVTERYYLKNKKGKYVQMLAASNTSPNDMEC